jgi:peptidoglycan/xylan/chitin deacetylase (PgdA/CDA1 family)
VTNPTVVSLTFDDTNADQLAAEQTMKARGLVGTFYTVSGWVGASGYLTQGQLSSIQADGNEIAGHSVTHPDLIQVAPTEAQAQICDGRAALQNIGFRPTDFAWPFSAANATTESQATACGYTTSRAVGDIVSPASCRGCAYAESLPPADPQYLKAPDQVDSRWTLAQMEAEVTNAVNHGGGWVILTFHHVCSPIGTTNCQANQSTTPTIFNSFISWLATYRNTLSNKTSVKTVDQVVRQYMGANYPAYKAAPPVASRPPVARGVNALSNPSLETVDTNTGFPSCYQPGGWGSNTVAWAAASPGHTGNAAEQLTVSGYSNGDAKLLPTLDLYSCAPSVTPGKTYQLSTWYQSTGTTQFALYYRDANWNWNYWTSSRWFATTPAGTWAQATFTTPAVPANATAMTSGLALIANSVLVTDDYGLVDPGTAATVAALGGGSTQLLDPASAGAITVTPALLQTGGVVTAAPSAPPPAPPKAGPAHSTARPEVPGRGKAPSNTKIAVPESGGPIGKG